MLADSWAKKDPARAARDLGLRGKLDELPLPVFVPLAALATLRREQKIQGIVPLISRYLIDTHAQMPAEFFERLLADNTRKIILLLDGLDEVPSTDERDYFRQQVVDLLTYANLRMQGKRSRSNT